MGCTFLRIMISYLCVKFHSLASLLLRDRLITDRWTDPLADEGEFIGHQFVKPLTKKDKTK